MIKKAMNKKFIAAVLAVVMVFAMAPEAIMAETVSQPQLKAPTKVEAKSIGYDRVKISWSKVTNAGNYEVYRCSAGERGYKKIKTLDADKAHGYTDSKVITGKTYKYKIKATALPTEISETGQTQDSEGPIQMIESEYSQVDSARPIPAKTAKLTGTSNGRGKIKIAWKKVAGASGYYVYKASKVSGKYKKIAVTKKNVRRYVSGTLRLNSKNYYRVRAYRTVKSTRVFGNLSNRRAVKNNLKYSRAFKVKAYAYCDSGYTASGMKAGAGRIAVDPRLIPLGTKLYVQGYGFCVAADTGGAIKGRVVDLWMSNNSKCNAWGVRYPKIYILK